MTMSRAVASCTYAQAQQRDGKRRREVGWICKACMHLVAAPFPVQQLLLWGSGSSKRRCILAATPLPLTVEASRRGLCVTGRKG